LSIVLIIRTLIGVIFLSSGISKIPKFEEHLIILKEYNIIPAKLIKIIGITGVMFEIFLGGMFLLGLFTKFAVFLSIILLTVYSIAISYNLLKGKKEISCGCGGILGNNSLSWFLVVRNFFLVLICTFLFFSDSSIEKNLLIVLLNIFYSTGFILITLNIRYLVKLKEKVL
jgi:uncharacterized membrane protein YphA (DoxX/SURF4 family)